MTDAQIEYLLEGVKETHGVPRSVDVEITHDLRSAIDEYEKALYLDLVRFVKRESGWPRAEVEEFVGGLMDEGDAPINVLLTLNETGSGIWDGRWNDYFRDDEVERLQQQLKRRLSRFAEGTGTGSVNDALMEAALEAQAQSRFTSKEAKVLREVESLESSYAQAQSFDDAQMEKWVRRVSRIFTKRTDFPKLGYIIHRLNELGIPSVLWGKSFHGPILRVHKDFQNQAWSVLGEPVVMGGKWRASELDEIEDDDPVFYLYEKERPDPDLWNGAFGDGEGNGGESGYFEEEEFRWQPPPGRGRLVDNQRRQPPGTLVPQEPGRMGEREALERELAQADDWRERDELRRLLAELERAEAEARYYAQRPNRGGRRRRVMGGVPTQEFLPGGYAEASVDQEVDPEQLAMGIEVEMEHVDPRHPHAREIAAEIARDHLLGEDPYYYDKLVAAGL